MSSVLVVGAGMAGIRAARRLSGDHDVVVVDKGRGVGGRMAHRRGTDGSAVDHGAQFFTARDEAFAAEVESWRAEGIVDVWHRADIGPDGPRRIDGHPRYRGAPEMTAPVKHLARDLDVRTGVRLGPISRRPDGLHATDASGRRWGPFDAAVVTAPVPQAVELLEPELIGGSAELLADLRYHRCIAVMVSLSGPSPLPVPGALRPAGEPLEWIADNARKGVSSVGSLTIHLGSRTSDDWWDLDDTTTVARTRAAVAEVAEPAARGWGPAMVHRWRYARPRQVHPETSHLLDGATPVVLAGDVWGGPLVEGAARSGDAAGDRLAARLVDGPSTEDRRPGGPC